MNLRNEIESCLAHAANCHATNAYLDSTGYTIRDVSLSDIREYNPDKKDVDIMRIFEISRVRVHIQEPKRNTSIFVYSVPIKQNTPTVILEDIEELPVPEVQPTP